MADAEILLRVARCSRLNAASREHCWAMLDESEKVRNRRFRFQADQDRHMLGRALLRSAIAEQLAVEPQSLTLLLDAHGKPYLEKPTGTGSSAVNEVSFNLSHSGDWVVVALAEAPVGIDVEHTARNNDVLALADRYFFGRELAELQSFPEAEQPERFFDYWTLKEAYMKARGEGIALGLENFGFRLRGDSSPSALNGVRDNPKRAVATIAHEPTSQIQLMLDDCLDDDPAAWQFLCATPEEDYRLALAIRSERTLKLRVEEYFSERHTQALDWTLNAAWQPSLNAQ
ncbi:MAG: 4'-phosphopantetheinyl transferase superfamily protein [Pseudomonadales bacterium]|nr:4'-phosphopantetheinyl transferase superfamily protein [Pseudomonadales bacterium]